LMSFMIVLASILPKHNRHNTREFGRSPQKNRPF
jgi:hypothetical protein